MRERVIVVLGMHRSGTSVLSAALECLGVHFGHRLLGPRDDNPKGFWEDEDFVELNERLFVMGGSLSSALGFDLEKVRGSPDYPAMYRRMKTLLRARLDEAPLFGLKDPRMPRLIALWGEALGEMGVEVAFVLPLRNPLSVAASLGKRDAFPTSKSLLLWYEHMVQGLHYAAPREMVVVDYDAFMDEPREALLRLSERLRLDFDDRRFEGFVRGILSEDLRHSRFSDADLLQHEDGFPALIRLYGMLKCLSQDKYSTSSEIALAEIRQANGAFADIWPLLRRCGELDVELWRGAQHLEATQKYSVHREKQLSTWIASLESTVRDVEQARLNEQVRQRDHLHGQETSFAAREAELLAWISTLENTVQSGEEQRRANQVWFDGQLQAEILQRDHALIQLQRLQAEIDQRDQLLCQLQGSLSWRLTRPLRWCRGLLAGS
ncbi:hypothetical protein N7414_01485 [Pseudomonas sp. GD04087]|uniref:sulfotransferase family protein n=1 Tax=unclassified Pseudomonas TaxID=196821 RepID=UPI0024479D21|nr:MULTISPECIES: hypothetical protein [unclassified Pseudomonas]MDH0287768.1 hypothetical protein [Pseudomonas sp. GD04087]MDH1050807.1 hypothetical protein [Pseudomonas sp. GD03903]MDH2002789.1 hypothetical protein [Pseudomonas sp. GD03691]